MVTKFFRTLAVITIIAFWIIMLYAFAEVHGGEKRDIATIPGPEKIAWFDENHMLQNDFNYIRDQIFDEFRLPYRPYKMSLHLMGIADGYDYDFFLHYHKNADLFFDLSEGEANNDCKIAAWVISLMIRTNKMGEDPYYGDIRVRSLIAKQDENGEPLEVKYLGEFIGYVHGNGYEVVQ